MVNLPNTGSNPPRPGEPLAPMHPEPEIDRQLARLFGESIFGAWLDPAQYMAAGTATRKQGRAAKRLLALAGICAVVALSVYLAKAGFRRQEDKTREQVAHDLSTFIAEGELFRAAKQLDLLSPRTAPLDEMDPHLGLILRTEAALYRYHDGDNGRWRRMAPFLAKDSGNAGRELTRMVTFARAERVPRKAWLENAIARLPREPEGFAVLASVHEAEGNLPAAREAWGRAEDLGPLWLPLRLSHAFFEFRTGRPKQAAAVVAGMIAVAPESPWTLSARALFAPSLPLPPPDPKEKTKASSEPPAPLPPVGVYHQHVVSAYVKVKAGDLPQARSAIAKALDAVDGAPFVLDVFDLLVEAKAYDLAFELTSLEAWPRQNPLARERLAALEAARTAGAPAEVNTPVASEAAGDVPVAKAVKAKKSSPKAAKKSAKRKVAKGAGKKAGRRG